MESRDCCHFSASCVRAARRPGRAANHMRGRGVSTVHQDTSDTVHQDTKRYSTSRYNRQRNETPRSETVGSEGAAALGADGAARVTWSLPGLDAAGGDGGPSNRARPASPPTSSMARRDKASMSYRAIVCADWGLPETLQLREHAAAPPGPGQLAIDVHCCGVNFPDFLMIQGKYQVGGDDSSDAALLSSRRLPSFPPSLLASVAHRGSPTLPASLPPPATHPPTHPTASPYPPPLTPPYSTGRSTRSRRAPRWRASSPRWATACRARARPAVTPSAIA